jgi:cytochrome c peroxidase
MRFAHLPKPRAAGRTAFDTTEERGAALFREHCERCPQARLRSDDPTTRVVFDAWPMRLFDEGGSIVWASDGYEKTGVTPYVHARGARVPSLRRLYKKYPYFTDGSASSLDDVVERARFGAAAFYHDAGTAPDAAALGRFDRDQQRALVAFLGLL